MYLESTRVDKLLDKPSITPESLIGTLGGTLNLWIGISILTLFELLELMLLLCCADHTTIKTGEDAAGKIDWARAREGGGGVGGGGGGWGWVWGVGVGDGGGCGGWGCYNDSEEWHPDDVLLLLTQN